MSLPRSRSLARLRGVPVRPTTLLVIVLALTLPGAASAQAACAEVPGVHRCPVWTMQHDVGGPGGHTSDEADAVAVAPDGGRVFVSGGTSGQAIEVLALEAGTGEPAWTARVDGARSDLGTYVALRMAPDGSRLFLLASTPGGDFLIVALDPATGDDLWSAEWGGGGSDLARDLAVSPHSTEVYVTGSSEARGKKTLVLVALSAAAGTELWTVRYSGPTPSWSSGSTGHEVRVSPDSTRVFVAGRSSGNSSTDLVTLAYDVPEEDEEPSASWAWVERFTPAVNVGVGSRVGFAVSEDGDRLVTSGEGDNNFWTIGYDAAQGDELWSAELHGTALSEGWVSTLDETAVEISEDRVFVAISKAWDPGPLMASYDLDTGAELWSTRNAAGPALSEAGFVVSPGGDSLYTLTSSVEVGYGAAVAAWDAANGSLEWVGRMQPTRDGIYGNALAISPSGDALYATGGTSPPERGFAEIMNRTADFLTWSYDL